VTALAGKAIAARYYAQGPDRSYFMGCSAGGIQAMWLAQRFPDTFDGIVAGGPALRLSHNFVAWISANRALMSGRDEPVLSQADLVRLNRAVVEKCDLNDGLKDGLIGDPRRCGFDPVALQCGSVRTGECLNASQVDAVKKIYAGPVDSRGGALTAPIALRGSETTWLQWFAGSRGRPTAIYDYMKDAYRYAIFPIDFGPGWSPEQFDFDRDPPRLGAMVALEPNHPDLHAFKARGGRLLAYTGWSDAVEGVSNTIAYYDTVERVMGGRAATQDFFRLFVVPGMEHCSGGPGPYAIDYLSYLERWVEAGEAPMRVLGAHVRTEDLLPKAMAGDGEALKALRKRFEWPLDPATVEFARPVFPYPASARYRGRGDPTRAESFTSEEGSGARTGTRRP
jgi:feruloyl esterase